MENPSHVPEMPPIIAKMEQERHDAFSIVLEKIREKREQFGTPVSVIVYGKEYPMREGSESDRTVAEAQMLHRAAQEILSEMRGVDYRQEEAAAKLVELLDQNELLTTRYAELIEYFPDLADTIKKMVPGVSPIIEEGYNDDRYIVH
jgi:hypothetical protein